MNQESLDTYFIGVAVLTAKLSHAVRKKVGAVIVKDKRICAIGYNGTPSGFSNECEEQLPNGELKTKDTVVHAEANAIYWCAKSDISTDGATLYQTLSPCATCALGIIQSGIKRVVYIEDYRNLAGVEILKKAGIEVMKVPYNVGG